MKKTLILQLSDYKNLMKNHKFYCNGISLHDVKRYIEEQRLFTLEYNSYHILCLDEVRYLQILVEVTTDAYSLKEICSFLKENELVCYVVKNSGSLQEEYENLLLEAGFEKYKEICEYMVDIQSVLDESDDIEKREMEHRQLNMNELDEIYALWRNNLPYQELPYMEPNDIQNIWGKQNKIIVKMNKKGRCCAVCCYDGFLGKITIRHVVVDSSARGQNLAARLIHRAMIDAKLEGNKKARSWIESDNIASQKSFEKNGFVRTDQVSVLYCFNRQDEKRLK